MILTRTFMFGLSSLAIGLGAAISVATAQDAAPVETPAPQMQQAPATQAASVDDAKLKSFAVAFLEVTKVTRSYQPMIEAADTPDAQKQLREEASQKMVETVNDAQGISVEEYNMIIQAAQTDPELAQRINSRITEAAGEQPPAPQTAPQE